MSEIEDIDDQADDNPGRKQQENVDAYDDHPEK